MKALHILYQSAPDISGSSTRTASILRAQNKLGLEVVAVTSPFQKGYSEAFDLIDGIVYYRCFKGFEDYGIAKPKTLLVRFRKALTIVSFFFKVFSVAQKEKPDVIHSHAMAYCAFVGVLVAFLLRVPHVYEIRSAWVDNSNFTAGKIQRNLFKFIEYLAVKMSGNIVVISHGLHARYNKFAKRVLLVANAVDDDLVYGNAENKISLGREVVNFGYVGSIIPLEGLDDVLHAFKNVKSDNWFFKVYGGGKDLEKLVALTSSLGLAEKVKFFGKVPKMDIDKAYVDIDCIINYRKDEPVAHSVTPLKPLEAMALKKLVVVSDVRGMTELVSHETNGIVVPHSRVDLLTNILESIVNNPMLFISIVENGYKHVSKNKLWSVNAKNYSDFYNIIIDEF